MKGLSAWFFCSALVYAVVGVVAGMIVNIVGASNQAPTHAHILEIGWVSFALFAFFYHLFPVRAATALANAHFWLAQLSLIALVIGFYLIYVGLIPIGEPISVIASAGYLLSMLIFVLVALPIVGAAGAPSREAWRQG